MWLQTTYIADPLQDDCLNRYLHWTCNASSGDICDYHGSSKHCLSCSSLKKNWATSAPTYTSHKITVLMKKRVNNNLNRNQMKQQQAASLVLFAAWNQTDHSGCSIHSADEENGHCCIYTDILWSILVNANLSRLNNHSVFSHDCLTIKRRPVFPFAAFTVRQQEMFSLAASPRSWNAKWWRTTRTQWRWYKRDQIRNSNAGSPCACEAVWIWRYRKTCMNYTSHVRNHMWCG